MTRARARLNQTPRPTLAATREDGPWMSELANPLRLEALQRTGLLDTPPEPAFDRLTRIAGELLRTPVALVSLVDPARQFFKSQTGLPAPYDTSRQTPLSHSFCQHVVTSEQVLSVRDARHHPVV